MMTPADRRLLEEMTLPVMARTISAIVSSMRAALDEIDALKAKLAEAQADLDRAPPLGS